MRRKEINPKELWKSLGYAINGVRTMVVSQRHALIYLVVSIFICLLSALLRISSMEWCWIIIAIVTVWTAEAINTAFEFLCDVASPAFHPLVEKAKDVAAGAVLICAIGAAVIGIIVLGPPLMQFLGI